MYLQRLSTFKLLKNMPFFYILYILIKKILKILYWGRNLQGRTGKGPKPLGAEPEKGRNLWHSSSRRISPVHVTTTINEGMISGSPCNVMVEHFGILPPITVLFYGRFLYFLVVFMSSEYLSSFKGIFFKNTTKFKIL